MSEGKHLIVNELLGAQKMPGNFPAALAKPLYDRDPSN